MKTLITGATGFVGTHLTRFLLDKGLELKVLVRNKNKIERDLLPHVEVALGDITNKESLSHSLQGVDQVFHLAGVVGYTKSEYPLMHNVNVVGTKNLLESMKISNIENLLHFSSVVAVGASYTPISLDEESPFNIRHLNLGYFNTKKDSEDLVLQAFQEGWLKPKIVNPSTIYGYGDAKKGSRGVQLKVAKGKFPFYTPGGVSVVAIEDVLEGAWNAFQKGRPGERYILSGENITIKELFETIADIAQVTPPNILLPKTALNLLGRVGDILEKINKKGPLNSETAWTSQLFHWFNSSKAQREFGFKVTPARAAIENSVRWIQENQN